MLNISRLNFYPDGSTKPPFESVLTLLMFSVEKYYTLGGQSTSLNRNSTKQVAYAALVPEITDWETTQLANTRDRMDGHSWETWVSQGLGFIAAIDDLGIGSPDGWQWWNPPGAFDVTGNPSGVTLDTIFSHETIGYLELNDPYKVVLQTVSIPTQLPSGQTTFTNKVIVVAPSQQVSTAPVPIPPPVVKPQVPIQTVDTLAPELAKSAVAPVSTSAKGITELLLTYPEVVQQITQPIQPVTARPSNPFTSKQASTVQDHSGVAPVKYVMKEDLGLVVSGDNSKIWVYGVGAVFGVILLKALLGGK